MEIVIRDKEGKPHEFDAELLKVTDRGGVIYHIEQDIEKGLEILVAGIGGKILIEPRCANQVTVIGIDE